MVKVVKKWADKINFRSDGRIEWCCEHGIGHTIYAPDGSFVHGCDGCCVIFNDKKKK